MSAKQGRVPGSHMYIDIHIHIYIGIYIYIYIYICVRMCLHRYIAGGVCCKRGLSDFTPEPSVHTLRTGKPAAHPSRSLASQMSHVWQKQTQDVSV